jgi:four helix bundle protein
MITSFLDLEVYKESFQLNIEMEEFLKSFPQSEKFLLIDQMKRCSRSIPAQIAEGYGRKDSVKEFQKYLRDCIGEANEMVNHLMLSRHKGYIKTDNTEDLIRRYNQLGKKLFNLKTNWRSFK